MRVKANEASKFASTDSLAAITQKSYCEPSLIREPHVIFLFTGPPTILVKPQSQQVKAGGIASFYCTAEGAPPPQIHWRKNGKRISRKSALSHIFLFCLQLDGLRRRPRFLLRMLEGVFFGARSAKSMSSRFARTRRERCGEKEWKFYRN